MNDNEQNKVIPPVSPVPPVDPVAPVAAAPAAASDSAPAAATPAAATPAAPAAPAAAAADSAPAAAAAAPVSADAARDSSTPEANASFAQNDNTTPTSPDAAAAAAAPAAAAAAAPANPEEEEPKKGKKKWLLLLLLLLVAAVIAGIIWFMQPVEDNSLKPDPNVKIGALTDMGDLEKILDEGMLTFSINSTPVFASGTAEGNLLIENPEINNNRFTVTIFRNDTNDIIYQSGYLDPGQYIENAKLTSPPPAGTYKCTARFDTYKLVDEKPIGQAAAELTVHIQS